MSQRRPKVARLVEAEVLIQARRRCCVCFGLLGDISLKKGQISHINGNRSDNRAENLAFLCLDHHDELDSQSSQSKGLTPNEVRHFKHELADRVRALNAESAKRAKAAPASAADVILARFGQDTDWGRRFGSLPGNGRDDLSSHGRWRLAFEHTHHKSLWVGLISEDHRLFARSGRDWHAYDHETRKMEFLWADDDEDVERREERLAAKDGFRLYASEDGSIIYYQLITSGMDVTCSEVQFLRGHGAKPIAASFDVNSDRFVSVDESGEVILWDWTAQRIRNRATTVIENPVELSFFPNPAIDQVVVNDANGRFELLDLHAGKSLGHSRLAVRGPGASVWHSLDCLHLVASDNMGRWDIVSAVGFEPIDREDWLAIFTTNRVARDVGVYRSALGPIFIFEYREGGPGNGLSADLLPPLDKQVTSMALAPDGRLLATVLEDRTLRIWERFDETRPLTDASRSA